MPPERVPRPRQDPVSCDSCRKKKLKCDRLHTCSNCVARGIDCIYKVLRGHPRIDRSHAPAVPIGAASISDLQAENDGIKLRLKRLEEMLLHREDAITNPKRALESPATTISLSYQTEEDSSGFKIDIEQILKTGTQKQYEVPNLGRSISIRAESMNACTRLAVYQTVDNRSVVLPDEHQAMTLFEAYVDFLDPVQHITHIPTVREGIRCLYSDLRDGHVVDPTRAVLLLSAMASVGMHWSLADPFPPNSLFLTPHDAFQTSSFFLRSALDILDVTRRTTGATLETIQASMFIVFLLYHLEGFSPRLRSIFATALFSAKDLGFHRIDLKPEGLAEETQADIIDKEVRRRVWWHLASTDWAVAFSGGHLEGTYHIEPRHMRVNKPRNVSDEELATEPADFNHPETVPTIMSFSFPRIRLNEVCRQIADLEQDMSHENLPLASLLEIDAAFDDLIDKLPPFMRLDAANHAQFRHLDAQQPYIKTQRYVVGLFIHSRRCQLHIPFLLKASRDSTYSILRERCLAAARAVIWTHEQLAQEEALSLNLNSTLCGPLHLFFYAAVVLVMDLCVHKDKGNDAERKAEIERAFKTIERGTQKSVYAGILLDSLMSILRRHQIGLKPQEPLSVSMANAGDNMQGDGPMTMTPFSMHGAGNELTRGMEFDDMWRSFVDSSVGLDTLSWDALISDLDFRV